MIVKGAVRSESLIQHFIYSKIVRGVWFLISFIDVPANPLKLLLEGGGEKGACKKCKTVHWKVGSCMIGKGAVRSERVSFHT